MPVDWSALAMMLQAAVLAWIALRLAPLQQRKTQAETAAARADTLESDVDTWKIMQELNVANLRTDLEVVRRERSEEREAATKREAELQEKIKGLEAKSEEQAQELTRQGKRIVELQAENLSLHKQIEVLRKENASLREQVDKAGEKPKGEGE